jgi:hypothetical protein
MSVKRAICVARKERKGLEFYCRLMIMTVIISFIPEHQLLWQRDHTYMVSDYCL